MAGIKPQLSLSTGLETHISTVDRDASRQREWPEGT